jgi:Uncharacterized protein conserved in bacteria
MTTDLSDITQGRTILVYDNVCALCTGFARYVLERDRRGTVLFASAQGDTGREIFVRLGLDTTDFETNVLVHGGKAFLRSDAFIETMKLLGPPWSWWRLAQACPAPLRNAVYRPVARNRYRIFGRLESCHVPTPAERGRFLG